jgi:hypothetical protein
MSDKKRAEFRGAYIGRLMELLVKEGHPPHTAYQEAFALYTTRIHCHSCKDDDDPIIHAQLTFDSLPKGESNAT